MENQGCRQVKYVVSIIAKLNIFNVLLHSAQARPVLDLYLSYHINQICEVVKIRLLDCLIEAQDVDYIPFAGLIQLV